MSAAETSGQSAVRMSSKAVFSGNESLCQVKLVKEKKSGPNDTFDRDRERDKDRETEQVPVDR